MLPIASAFPDPHTEQYPAELRLALIDATTVRIKTRADIMGVLWAESQPGCAPAEKQLLHPDFSGKCKHCCKCHGGPCVSVILDGLSWTHAPGQNVASRPSSVPTSAASPRPGAATPALAAQSYIASPATKNATTSSSAHPLETDSKPLYSAATTASPFMQSGQMPQPSPIARQQTETEADAIRQKAVSQALRERFAKEYNFVPVAKMRGNVWAASWDYNLQRLRLTETYKKGTEVAGYTTKKDDWYKYVLSSTHMCMRDPSDSDSLLLPPFEERSDGRTSPPSLATGPWSLC